MRDRTMRLVSRRTPDDICITPVVFKEKSQVPRVIVESADSKQCEILRHIYLEKETGGLRTRVHNLFLLCWSIKAGRLCCALEWYKRCNETDVKLDQVFVKLSTTCSFTVH